MKKQEYDLMMIQFQEDYEHMCRLKDEYITSLEQQNARLEKINSAALEKLSEHACPSNRNNYGQPCNDSNDCVACWHEFLMQETADGATQTPLPVSDATQEEEK